MLLMRLRMHLLNPLSFVVQLRTFVSNISGSTLYVLWQR